MKEKQSSRQLTKQDLIQALKPLARKSDLVHFVTKDDLIKATSHLATRDELNQATSHLATKDELKQGFSNVVTKDEFKQGLEKLQKSHDELVLMVKKGFDETPTREEINNRFDIVDHRLSKLEEDRHIINNVKQALAL